MRFILWTVIAPLLAANAVQISRGAGEDPTPKVRPEVTATVDQPTDYVQVPPPSDDALRYYHSGNVLWLINTAWGILIPGLFLFTGLSARIRTLAQRIGRRRSFTVGIYFLISWILLYFIDWPLNYYEGFVRPHE